jgi:hypothetical protein
LPIDWSRRALGDLTGHRRLVDCPVDDGTTSLPIMSSNLPLIAGTISTGIFAVSTMPMVLKAARTQDLSSYSGGNLVLSNLGNVLYAIYVFSMPMGPAWALYGFNLTVSATMLVYWLRYRTPRPRHEGRELRSIARPESAETTVGRVDDEVPDSRMVCPPPSMQFTRCQLRHAAHAATTHLPTSFASRRGQRPRESRAKVGSADVTSV